MNLYFATTTSQHIPYLLNNSANNILISYLGKNLINLVKDNPKVNLIVDSGAYSVWTKGKVINLKEYIAYCKWLKLNNNLRNLYFVNLDIIPGSFGRRPTKQEREESAEKGWENYEIMKAHGLQVMHLFHQHEDFKWLERLVNDSSDYIGISPANDLKKTQRLNWLKQVFNIVKDKKKTHGFGVTAIDILKEIPFYSADSSNFATPVRFGCVIKYNNLKTQNLRYRKKRDAFILKQGAKAINGKGYEYLDEVVRGFVQSEKDVSRLWKLRGIEWQD